MHKAFESKPDLILASASIRRRQLLNLFNIHYDVEVPDIDESVQGQEEPLAYVRRIARQKADLVWGKKSSIIPVLAADTTISFNGEIIGKPSNQEEARECLYSLSGCEHQVLTAICLYTHANVFETHSISTVKFKRLSSMEITTYCNTNEPLDKAGAYAIQGHAATFVEYFNGSYTAVVGLPLRELGGLFDQAKLLST